MLKDKLLHGVSAVIPVFNAQQSLSLLIQRLVPVLQSLARPFEILLIDDGSTDDSWALITSLAIKYDSVRGIRLMRNYGQHSALLCGIRHVRFDVTVTLDDDLQNPPEEIPKLLAELSPNLDVVYGTPERDAHGLFRNLASQITKIVLQKGMGAETARNVSAFRAFRTELREAFETYRAPYVSVDVLLTWGTTRFASVRVEHAPRTLGDSNYSLRKLLAHALNMLTGFTTIPLQLASLIGIVFTCFGLLVLCFVLIRYFIQGTSAPGFPFLASVISIFSGAQLFSLGIVGEYIARIHLRSMDRPSYTVRSSVEPQEV
ncbi:MAG TPA: glycosyltransferase [Bryobacteraceae bacterium]|nr:glycosyltransferase [Bryobacteraceae bacterium]